LVALHLKYEAVRGLATFTAHSGTGKLHPIYKSLKDAYIYLTLDADIG